MAARTTTTAEARPKRSVSADIAAFLARATEQAERLPSVTIGLDVGQFIAGTVRKRGAAYHEFGESPVVEFRPGTWETDAPVTWAKDGKGQLVEDVPEDRSAVFVGVGMVLDQLFSAQPDDKLFIIRHDDQPSPVPGRKPYANYEVLCERAGVMLSLKEHVRSTVAKASAAIGREMPGATVVDLDEEPFGA